MKINALGLITDQWYKPLNDSDFEFHFKPLSGIQYASIEQYITRDDIRNKVYYEYEALLSIFRFCLLGWRNLRDIEGNEVEFLDNFNENIQRLPFELVNIIANHVMANSVITSGEKKK